MTTPSLPSSRPQPISLDVDIELTELTPAEGLPASSPANPAGVDVQALLAREDAAFARIFRKGKPVRPRGAAQAAPRSPAPPAPEPHAPVAEPQDVAPAAAPQPLPAAEELDAFVGELLASAEHDKHIDAVPVLAAAETAAPTLSAAEELDAFVGELLASAEHDRHIDAAPVLAPEAAAPTASEELDAFVGELLASAEHDRHIDAAPVLAPEAAAPAASEELDAFVGELLASAEHDRHIDAAPVLAPEAAAPAASEELDAFVGELLASADRDRQMDVPPVLLPVHEDPVVQDEPPVPPLPEVGSEGEELDFAFEEALLNQFAEREAARPAAEPPVVMEAAQLAEGDDQDIEAHLAALEARLAPPSVQDALVDASPEHIAADLAQLADDLDALLQAQAPAQTDLSPTAEHAPLAVEPSLELDLGPMDAPAAPELLELPADAADGNLDFDLDALLLDASPVEAAPMLDAVAEPDAPTTLPPAELTAVTALTEDAREAEALATLVDELDPPAAEDVDHALSLDLDAMLMAEALAPVLDAPLVDSAPTVPELEVVADAAPPAAAPAALDEALGFDLDDMLMGEISAPAAAAPVVPELETVADATPPAAEPVALDESLGFDLDDMLMGEISAPAAAAPTVPELEAVADVAPPAAAPAALDEALGFDLDDMLMGETPAPAAAAPIVPELETVADAAPPAAEPAALDEALPLAPAASMAEMLDLDLDALLMAEAAPDVPTVSPMESDALPAAELAPDAPMLDAVAEPLPETLLDLDAMLMASTDASEADVDAPLAVAELDMASMLMADDLTPSTAGLADAAPASELMLDLDAMLLEEPPLTRDDDIPLAEAEQTSGLLLEADSIEPAPVLSLAADPQDHDDTTPLLLDADARAPAVADSMLDLDLPLTPPPVLDALHDDEAAPVASMPDAPPPAVVASPLNEPTAPDGDVLAMLAQALEGNWLAIAQGGQMQFRTFRRGLDTLGQRLAPLPATGLPALVAAIAELADNLPISGPSAWTADAVSRALELLSDTLISLPQPSTTQRAAVHMLTRELLAGAPAEPAPVLPEAVIELTDESAPMPTDASAPEAVLLEDVAPAAEASLAVEPPAAAELEAEAEVDAESAGEWAVAAAPAAETTPETEPLALAEPDDTPPAEDIASDIRDADALAEAVDLAAGDIDLAEMLAELPALTDVLEDEPTPEALAAALALAPEIDAESDAELPVDAPTEPVAEAEHDSESLANWLAEHPVEGDDTTAAVLSAPSVILVEDEPEDDDWTQPPLEELSRLAKEAPLASPEPEAEAAEPPPAPEVVTHWPADEEAALLPGFDVLPELGRADEPAPLAVSASDMPLAADADAPAEAADSAPDELADVDAAPSEVVDAELEPAEAEADVAAPAADAVMHSISLEDIPHLRQALGSGFPTVAQALAEPVMAPAFPNSIAVDDIPLLRAGTLEALLERIEPVEETPPSAAPASTETDAASADTPAEPAAPAPEVTPLGPAQLAAFFASLDAEPSEPRPDPAIDLAAFLVVAQGRVQRMVQECRAARTQGIGPGFVAAADELGHNASEAGVSAMASLAAALASALTRPLSPQAVLELATDTVAVLSVMVSQGQRQEPIEPAPDMVAALEALTAKPPVRKAL